MASPQNEDGHIDVAHEIVQIVMGNLAKDIRLA